MKKNIFYHLIIIAITVFIFQGCEPNENSQSNVLDIIGYVQKGPFVAGSSITINELSSELEPTGQVYSTTIIDNTGKFELPNVELESNYVNIIAQGFYFNERNGSISEAQLTLQSIVDITNIESFNINVLSHLEKERIIALINEGHEFIEAKKIASDEILEIFNFESIAPMMSEKLDISSPGDYNAILLAVSLILQGDRTTSEFFELMSQIIIDFKEDGILDDKALGTKLVNGIHYADMNVIRTNIEEKYNELGIDYEISDFEQYITHFLSNTDFKISNEFEFPIEGTYGTNILPLSLLELESYHLNDRKYSVAIIAPEKRTMTVKITGSGVHVIGGTAINMTGSRVTEPVLETSFSTTSSGLCDVEIKFFPEEESPKLKFEYYEDDNTSPTFVKEVEVVEHELP